VQSPPGCSGELLHVEELQQEGDAQRAASRGVSWPTPPAPGRELTGVLLAFPVKIPLAFFLVMLKFFR